MITQLLTFNADDLDRLRSLIGRTWSCLGSVEMSDDGSRTWFDIFLATDSGSITLCVRSTPVDLDGVTEISSLGTEADGRGEDRARKKGSVFFHDKGSVIDSVQVIRERIQRSAEGRTTHEVVIDRGIIVRFDSVAVGIVLTNDFADEISVVRSEVSGQLLLPASEYLWESNLEETFAIEQTLIDIG